MSEFKSGSWARAWGLGKSLAKASTQLARAQLKERTDLAGARVRQVKAARELITSMGELKGPLMKLGQILSLTDDMIFSPEISALFRSLQREGKRMSRGDVEGMFRQEFGRTPQDLFREWKEEAIAAASIGQVHWARLASGEEVAVKVQYPGIERAVFADFSHLARLEQVLALLAPQRPNVRGMLEELRRSMLLECDYEREARNMDTFRTDITRPFPCVRIPKVYRDYSTKHILTMEYMHGMELEEAEELPQEKRNEFCQQLYDLHMFSLYEKRHLHTDPQHGNYLFGPDEIILLDFGSTKEFSASFIRTYVRLLHAVEEDNYCAYITHSCELGLLALEDSSQLKERHFELIKKLYLPYTRPGVYRCPTHNPFDLLRDFLKGVQLRGRSSPREEFLLLDRANLGLYTKIRKLGGEINWTTGRDKYRAQWLE